jgi:hypothetical protein
VHLLILLVLMVVSFSHSTGTDNTSTVKVVVVNKSWGGVLFRLDGVAQVDEAGCSLTWYYIALPGANADISKAMLSTLLTAKSTGTKVRVLTNGCVSTPVTPAANLESIDLDIR